ncbi:MAG TPA: 2-oxo acid dehydrogenase subunit E2 [Kofleriaceae bacterium]|jgi:pyruvate dehydrogenase E2 component (dihydrolipoamide acetyltransferase)|nr:2-oxo acid dehydrogenase subunit E2 [Kofleriaceae bacterium]
MKLTGWRRVASAMWRAPQDPQIYGTIELEAAPIARLVDDARARGVHLTPTVVVGRAVAHALAAVPELNVRIVGGHAIPRPSIDVFIIAAVGGGGDLSGVKVVDADKKHAIEIARELADRAGRMKRGDDPDFEKTKSIMEKLPMPLLRVALRATSFAANTLDLDLPALGVHRAPFGSAMITSVGMFGLPSGFAPIAWMYGVPLLVAVGQICDRAVVEQGRVVVRSMLPLSASIDHRYVDGWHISRAMAALREYLAAPATFERAA